MQQWELYKQGVEPADFVFTGMPHDKVVAAVLEGKADAGFVRSGIIESLVREGKIESGAVKVLNPQSNSGFPQMTSTALYPEWPISTMPETDSDLIKAVTLALLNLESNHPLAKSMGIYGFSPPGDYSKVEAIMLRLNLHPLELKNIKLDDFYYRYRDAIWSTAVMLMVIVLLLIKLFRIHQRLRRTFLKYHLVADYTSDWEYWLSPTDRLIYMSPSCQQVTGYEPQAFKQNPELLVQLVHPDDKEHFVQHWQIHNHSQQLGEFEFRILNLDGQTHWIHHLCRTVFDNQGRYQGTRVSNRDITSRKTIELELHLHDAALQACADAIAITDLNAVIKWVNPAFCALTGYSESEVLGIKLPEMVNAAQHDKEIYPSLWETIRSGQYWRGEIINQNKNGDLYHEQISITPIISDIKSITHFVVVKQDISERKEIEAQIQQLAFYDPLTQLANRRLLVDRLEYAINSSQRTRKYGALLFLDLDRFKPLNDTFGHDVGDHLLVEVAQRLKASVRQQDTVARLGGDEFVVLLLELDADPKLAGIQAEQVAKKIQFKMLEPYTLQANREQGDSPIHYELTVSIGINLFMDQESSGHKLLKQADIAMYEAKHQGNNNICFFRKLPLA